MVYHIQVMKSALIVIDVQNDFLPPNGSLAVQNGTDIIPIIKQLIISRKWDFVVATRDWHPLDHVSFVSSHKGHKAFDQIKITNPDNNKQTVEQTLWPVHCVQNSWGGYISSDLDGSLFDSVVDKGFEKDSECYSPFFTCFGKIHTDLDEQLRQRNITDVYVVGLALDYCVFNTAMDAAKLGYKVTIIRNATRSVSEENVAQTLERLEAKGVVIQ